MELKDLIEWSGVMDLNWSGAIVGKGKNYFSKYYKCNGSTFIQLSVSQQTIQIFNISVPDKPLTNIELVRYARLLNTPDFRGVFMRDTLPQYPFNVVVS